MKKLLAVLIVVIVFISCAKKVPTNPAAENTVTLTPTITATVTSTCTVHTPTVTPTSTMYIVLQVELANKHIAPAYERFLITAQYQNGQAIENATVVVRNVTDGYDIEVPCDNSGNGTYTLIGAEGGYLIPGQVFRASVTINGITYSSERAAPGNIQVTNNGSRVTWDGGGNHDAIYAEAPSGAVMFDENEAPGTAIDSPYDISPLYFDSYGPGQYFYQVKAHWTDPDAFAGQGITNGFFADLYSDALIYYDVLAPSPTVTSTFTDTPTETFTATETVTPTATATVTGVVVVYSDAAMDGYNLGGGSNNTTLTLPVGDTSTNGIYQSAVSFTVPVFTGPVLSAVLRVYHGAGNYYNDPIAVFGPVNVSHITPNYSSGTNIPYLVYSDNTSLGAICSANAEAWFTLDVTSAVQDDISNSRAYSQFRLYFNSPSNLDGVQNSTNFWSGDNTTNKPELVITY